MKKRNKWLFEFTINTLDEVEETTESKDESGEDVKTIKKVQKPRSVNFALKRPNRKLYDKAELFYGVKMSEGIKAGLLTRSLLAKRYEDDGGAFSESEKKRYSELYLAIYQKENEYQRLQLNLDEKGDTLKKDLAQKLLSEIAGMRRELQDIENSQSNIFDQTAENRAKNQVIMWWVLNLSNWKEHDHNDYAPFFKGKNYDEKLEAYDEIEDSDEIFENEAIKRLAYYISFWYMGRAASQEDFDAIQEIYKANNEYEVDDHIEEEKAKEEEATKEAEAEAEADEVKKSKAKKTIKKSATKKKATPKKKNKKVEEATEKVVEEEAVVAVEENKDGVVSEKTLDLKEEVETQNPS
jgi:hypothetical protein